MPPSLDSFYHEIMCSVTQRKYAIIEATLYIGQMTANSGGIEAHLIRT